MVEKGQILNKEIFGEKVKILILDLSEKDKKMKITNLTQILIKGIN